MAPLGAAVHLVDREPFQKTGLVHLRCHIKYIVVSVVYNTVHVQYFKLLKPQEQSGNCIVRTFSSGPWSASTCWVSRGSHRADTVARRVQLLSATWSCHWRASRRECASNRREWCSRLEARRSARGPTYKKRAIIIQKENTKYKTKDNKASWTLVSWSSIRATREETQTVNPGRRWVAIGRAVGSWKQRLFPPNKELWVELKN